MTAIPFITNGDLSGRLNWPDVVDAIAQGHRLPAANINDSFLTRGSDTFLNRAAWIEGLGLGVKSVTVMANNTTKGLPSVQGVMIVFDAESGTPRAIIDSKVVTKWKTAADSALGALRLARPDSRTLLILGAGEVAQSLAESYTAMFPDLSKIFIWNRTQVNAVKLVKNLEILGIEAKPVSNLADAVGEADIIASATMSSDPILRGEWVSKGTHIDLIGAFRSDMREADDALIQRACIFVDSRETTIDHIGELKIPIARGIITREDILGDLYDIEAQRVGRRNREEITLFKNGGGAHLDLMTAGAILFACKGGRDA